MQASVLPNERLSDAANPAAKAACVSPSPAKRHPQNRADMTAGEGWGEGHTPASLHPASASARVKRIAPSPGLRPPSPPPVGGEGHDPGQRAPNERFSSAINPAAKAARVSPSPAKRHPRNRVDVTAGEGWGEGHTATSLRSAHACARVARVAPSPGLRPPSPPAGGRGTRSKPALSQRTVF